jgi:hypothetical protein
MEGLNTEETNVATRAVNPFSTLSRLLTIDADTVVFVLLTAMTITAHISTATSRTDRHRI